MQQSARADGAPAQLSGGNAIVNHLSRLLEGPANSRYALAIGELATALDAAAGDRPLAVAVSAVDAQQKLGVTAISLAALWGRWGMDTVLVDLGSGRSAVGGAITSTSPDLAGAVDIAEAEGVVTSISRLHAKAPQAGVIAAGKAEVMGMLSTGRLTRFIQALKKNHQRIVVCAPSVESGFPVLSLNGPCDRLVVSAQSGKARGGALAELAEQAMARGMRQIDVIWYD